ncbi:MAG TPA: SCO family protein [Balneolales bacterium]|nr:SCO family protein [Balneolales bacterium]
MSKKIKILTQVKVTIRTSFFRFSYIFFASFFILLLLSTENASAQRVLKHARGLEGVGITEKLGNKIPLNLTFTNTDGKPIQLGQIIKGDKPVILDLAYFTCPMLCPMIIHGMMDGVKKLDWSPNKDYKIITVSFDPHDTYKVAAAKKKAYVDTLTALGKKGAEDGWYFLTGKQDQIKKLTKAVGFGYKYLPKKKMYAHTATLIFLSSKGKISRYLYGISFPTIQLKNALGDAADGHIGSTLDKIILYCCQYDPGTGKYTASVKNIMKLSGVVVMILLGGFLGILWFKEKKAKHT